MGAGPSMPITDYAPGAYLVNDQDTYFHLHTRTSGIRWPYAYSVRASPVGSPRIWAPSVSPYAFEMCTQGEYRITDAIANGAVPPCYLPHDTAQRAPPKTGPVAAVPALERPINRLLQEHLGKALKARPANMPAACARCSEPMSASLDCWYGGAQDMRFLMLPDASMTYPFLMRELCASCRPRR